MKLINTLILSATIAFAAIGYAKDTKTKRKPNQVSTNFGKTLLTADGFAKRLSEADAVCQREKNLVVLALSQGEVVDADLVQEANSVFNTCIQRVNVAVESLLLGKNSQKIYDKLLDAKFVCIEEKETLVLLLSEGSVDLPKVEAAKKVYETCRKATLFAISKSL